MTRVSRRQFLSTTAAAGVAATILPYHRAYGANEDIRVGVVGFNGQGRTHINILSKTPGVRIVALCDVDSKVLNAQADAMEKKGGQIARYQDVRKMLENKDLDAITTASPNHWHSLVTYWACQAGKDVYVEKPCTHVVSEGPIILKAARDNKRIVQHGTQSRSDLGLKEAFEYIHKGELGKMLWVKGFCYKPRASIGKVTQPTPVPETIDYDLWCGPAPKEPLMRKKLHYDWHWVWPTGNGDIGNQGVHEMDMCRWALGQDGLPPRVMSFGGRFVVDDDATTPNTLVAWYDYKPVPMIFEVRGLPRKTSDDPKNFHKAQMDNYRGIRIGLVVQCEGGYFAGGSGGGWVYDKDNNKVKQFKGGQGGEHIPNWIKAVRSRKIEDLNADIAVGVPSAALCHLGNIPYRAGQDVLPDEIKEMTQGHAAATESCQQFLAHLEANGVDPKKTKPTMGGWLELDPSGAKFTAPSPLADKATTLLTREYRKPFVMP